MAGLLALAPSSAWTDCEALRLPRPPGGQPLHPIYTSEASDDYEAPGVALINQALADQTWPDEDPIGKRITWNDPLSEEAEEAEEAEEVNWWTIVGIVGNTNADGLDAEPEPETYLRYAQLPIPCASFVVRARANPLALQGQLRDAVLAVDPELPVFDVMSLEEVVSESLGSQRFNMTLLGAFASTAVLMAAVGLYGVLSYVLGMLLLASVALIACYLPARRASRVDAMVALRSE